MTAESLRGIIYNACCGVDGEVVLAEEVLLGTTPWATSSVKARCTSSRQCCRLVASGHGHHTSPSSGCGEGRLTRMPSQHRGRRAAPHPGHGAGRRHRYAAAAEAAKKKKGWFK
jgi:hypothetical protein